MRVNVSVSEAAADTTISVRREAASTGAADAVPTVSPAVPSTVPITRPITAEIFTADANVDRSNSLIVTMRLNDLSLLEQVVLALVVEAPCHGFAVVQALEGDEALRMAVLVRRPLVYRAIDRLAQQRLVSAVRTETGKRGSPRRVYRATPSGKRVSSRWLNATVARPRDARVELLAKFALRARRGLSSRGLARAQARRFEPLVTRLGRSPKGEQGTADLVRRWRHASLVATMSVLHDVANGTASG